VRGRCLLLLLCVSTNQFRVQFWCNKLFPFLSDFQLEARRRSYCQPIGSNYATVTLSSASPVRYQIYLIYPTYVLVLAVSRQDFATCVINAFLCLLKLKEKEGNPSTGTVSGLARLATRARRSINRVYRKMAKESSEDTSLRMMQSVLQTMGIDKVINFLLIYSFFLCLFTR
jgi:hypothetical protein